MTAIFEALRKNGRVQLANILEQWGQMPVKEYSVRLYEYQVPCALEPELQQAFRAELQRLNYSQSQREHILADLEQTRVLQTTTHLTASEGPTFFAIHWLACLGLSSEHYYPIGSFSGVPFSNTAWSGCLNYSNRYALEQLLDPVSPLYQDLFRAEKDRGRDTTERRILLIPGFLREALVYRTLIPERIQHILPYLCPPLQSLLPQAQVGASYSQWALQCCQNVSTHLLDQKKMVYFDLNEVISHYLLSILSQPSHPLYRIFFDIARQTQVLEEFGQKLTFFTAPYHEKNKEKWAPLTMRDKMLQGPRHQFPLTPESIIHAIQEGQLCPGVFLTFTILSFLNGFKCLGSFEQIEYLTQFQEKWLRLGFFDQEMVRGVGTDGMTTGRFVDEEGLPVFPLDVILGTDWDFPDGARIQDLVDPLLSRLLRTA